MAAKVVRCNHNARESVQGVEVSADDIPSLVELEEAIRAVPKHKAMLGIILPELLHADPATAARILYPCMIQSVLFCQEPVTWKGGTLCPLFKNKGSMNVVGNYRAILISQVFPKIMHRVARRRLLHQIGPFLQPMQVGGLRRMSVTFASQCLTALRIRAAECKRSHAVLFVDLQSAFYQAQRSAVTPNLLNIEEYDSEECRVSAATYPPALHALHASSNMQCWVQQILSCTWSQVQSGCQHVTDDQTLQAGTGTRPGDPGADLFFTATMAGILQQFVGDLHEELTTIACDGVSHLAHPITWVDDVAIFLEHDNPAVLLQILTKAAESIRYRCAERGFVINLAKGKTEALVRLEGRGSQRVHQMMVAGETDCLKLGSGEQVRFLPTTTLYTHLGIRQSASMSMEPEIAYRLGHAASALQECLPLAKHRWLGLEDRLHLVRSLVFSKLFFGAEVWQSLSEVQLQRLQAFVVRAYRHVLHSRNFRQGAHSTDAQVWARLEAPDALDLIRAARLRHLRHVLLHGPALLLALLRTQVDGKVASWFSLVREDMLWMQGFVPCLASLGDPSLQWDRWCAFIVAPQNGWQGKCKRAVRLSAQARVGLAQQSLLEAACDKSDGLGVGRQLEGQAPEPAVRHACPTCHKSFASGTALAAHQTLQHGTTASVRAWMPDPLVCGACLKRFGATQKLRQHLQYARGRCLRFLQTVWWPMTQAEIDAVETVAMKHDRAQYRAPALVTFGPSLPTLDQWQSVAPLRRWPTAPQVAPTQPALTLGDCMDWYFQDEDSFVSFVGNVSADVSVLQTFRDSVEDLPVDCRVLSHSRKVQELLAFLGLPVGDLDSSVRAPVTPVVHAGVRSSATVLVVCDDDVVPSLDSALVEISRQYQFAFHPLVITSGSLRLSEGQKLQDACAAWIASMQEGGILGVVGLFTSATWTGTRRCLFRTPLEPWGVGTLTSGRSHQVRSDNALVCAWILLAKEAARCGLPQAILSWAGGQREGHLPGVWHFPPLYHLLRQRTWTTSRMTLVEGVAAKMCDFQVLSDGLDAVDVCWHVANSRLAAPTLRSGQSDQALSTVTCTLWHAFCQAAIARAVPSFSTSDV
eukprot:Skav218504  [mRNA]  locus=scaffold3758:237968:241249:+ [translate_table: standard]